MVNAADQQKNGGDRTRARIAIVDDHPLVRQGFVELLRREPDFEVVGEAGDGRAALSILHALRADVALVDVSLPDMSGIELIELLRRRGDATKLLVISMHDESLYAQRVLCAGARGYINKSESIDQLVGAIRCVLAGGYYLSPELRAKLTPTVHGEREARSA